MAEPKELQIGDHVSAPRFGYLKHDFAGTIEKIYENSVMVFIDEHHEEDGIVVNEYNKRAVVSKKVAKPSKKKNSLTNLPKIVTCDIMFFVSAGIV